MNFGRWSDINTGLIIEINHILDLLYSKNLTVMCEIKSLIKKVWKKKFGVSKLSWSSGSKPRS